MNILQMIQLLKKLLLANGPQKQEFKSLEKLMLGVTQILMILLFKNLLMKTQEQRF